VSAACRRCGTELAETALACPACGSLVHVETLTQLAADAKDAAARGALEEARSRWTEALHLLPPQAEQRAAISAQVSDLTRRIDESASLAHGRATGAQAWWRRGLPGLAVIAVFALTKLKFLLLGLTKASTFVSMFAFIGVYWSMHGWPLAVGMALSIYVHEMGHVAMLRRLGLAASAPLFIPGVGALVMLKQQIPDPVTDARIGLAGPVWGLGAALAALAVHLVTGSPLWLAIAELTGFLNLFNLIPIWQLDGARGIHALDRRERWALVAILLLALALTGQRLLILVAAVAVWRAIQAETGPGSRRTLVTFAALALALAWLGRRVG
jgi:Zn-dependent protease